MTRVIMAEIHIRDVCDPASPGDCAPVICVPGAEEIEDLVSDHGIVFEDLVSDHGIVFEDPGEVEPIGEFSEESLEIPQDSVGITCPNDPGVRWDDSDCRQKTGLDEEAILLIRDAIVELQRMEGG